MEEIHVEEDEEQGIKVNWSPKKILVTIIRMNQLSSSIYYVSWSRKLINWALGVRNSCSITASVCRVDLPNPDTNRDSQQPQTERKEHTPKWPNTYVLTLISISPAAIGTRELSTPSITKQ